MKAGPFRSAESVALAALALCAACSRTPAPVAAPAIATNVLIVTIDTLRADRIGVYGAANVETPNIDRLAREGAWAPQATGARSAHAPLARVALHGSLPRRARHPRQRVADTRRQRPNYLLLGRALPAQRIRDRGVHRVRRAGPPVRTRARIRCVCGSVRAGCGPEVRRRRDGRRDRVAHRQEPLLRLGPSLRSPCPVRAAGALCGAVCGAAVRRRGGLVRRARRPPRVGAARGGHA